MFAWAQDVVPYCTIIRKCKVLAVKMGTIITIYGAATCPERYQKNSPHVLLIKKEVKV